MGDNTLASILTASSESGQLVNYTYSDTIEQDVLTSNFGNGQSIVYEYNDDGEITAIKLGEETKYGYEYLEATDEYGDVTEEWTELTDYVSGLKKIIEDSKTTVNDLNGNFIYSIEDVSDDYDGKKITVGTDVYTLVAEENKDTFKTNGTTDFTKEYTYANDELTKVETAGVTTSYSYNADKFISVLENILNDISKAYGYTYDDNGNITSETVTTKDANRNIVATETITYAYDDKEQLTSAKTSTTKYEYIYDGSGNILSKSETDLTTNATVTDAYVYDQMWKDKLISYNGQSITYDVAGNPTNYMGNALIWTMGRQLASFGDISYTYNEDGSRTSKTVNGVTTKFYLDGTRIVEQTDGTTTLYFFYDSNSEVIGFRYNESDYFYVKNVMGDIVGIADIDGTLIANYTYDPWGKVLSITGSNTAIGNLNPFRYRGYYYDSDIDLYYLQSRYYDPEVGRFINCDDVNYIGYSEWSISYNPFVYCENNPVNGSDPLGNSFIERLKLIFSSIISYFNTNSVSVLSPTSYDWFESSITMGNALKEAAGAKKSTAIMVHSGNFAFQWKNLRSKYVIIHTHGSSIGIYGVDGEEIITTKDMNSIVRNNTIKCVIITSCSVAGNTEENTDNFACALSRKINKKGVVVGCKVVVSGGDTNFQPYDYNSEEKPWLIYRNGVMINDGLPKTISMKIVYDYLKKHKYI